MQSRQPIVIQIPEKERKVKRNTANRNAAAGLFSYTLTFIFKRHMTEGTFYKEFQPYPMQTLNKVRIRSRFPHMELKILYQS